jgi:glycosyltransferase involved in cell wall biosynthesis
MLLLQTEGINMKKIFYVPIEPIVGRYCVSWYNNIPPAFKTHGWDVEVIDGIPLSDTIDVGTFLDINSTIHYKNSQMMKISRLFREKKVNNGDIFFFGDIEFWGIESVRLMSQMNKVSVKITGFCHAGSYTKEDAFAVAAFHQKYTEVGWIAACDKIFVGSQYHKNAIIDRRLKPYASKDDVEKLSSRIVVTGNPFFETDYKHFDVKKKKQIILGNRFDIEKRPNLSLDMAYILKKKIPDLNVVVTTSHPKFKSNRKWLEDMARGFEQDGIIEIKEGLTKDEYHKTMAESKISMSNSIEENFGIIIVEAMLYNTYPLLRNELSHPELVMNSPEFLFDDEDEVVDKVLYLLDYNEDIRWIGARYYKAIAKIALELGS